jgi:hypothetical protein
MAPTSFFLDGCSPFSPGFVDIGALQAVLAEGRLQDPAQGADPIDTRQRCQLQDVAGRGAAPPGKEMAP